MNERPQSISNQFVCPADGASAAASIADHGAHSEQCGEGGRCPGAGEEAGVAPDLDRYEHSAVAGDCQRPAQSHRGAERESGAVPAGEGRAAHEPGLDASRHRR